MAENLIDESVQVTEQPKPQKPASYISGLRDNLVHFYGENNVPDEASFTKKITSDAEYLKGVHANLIHAYGEENVPDINAFSDKVKKKDQTGLPTAQISGEVSAPIGLALPSQKDNRPDFQKGLDIAQKGYAMPSAGGTEKQAEQGSLSNIGQNLREKTVEKAADIAIPTIKFLRNLSGKLPGANKPEDIYNEQGELTDYGKSIEGSDFLGQAIKSFSETRQKERELQQTVGKLPETSAGKIAQGVTSIAPDMALALMTGGRNIFGGTSRLAAAGNALTGAFVREQAISGAAKGYDISDGKDVGETLGNIVKEGAKDAGTAMLYEGAGFLGGKIGNVLSSPLKNTTAKGAVNLLARLATFSLGTSNAQSLIDKGELASEDEVFKNLGIAGVLEAFHGTLHGAGVAAGKVAEKVAQDKYIAGLKKVNDIRAGSAIQNFMKASPDVIDNLVKSKQTAQHLNLAAMDAVKRAEGMEDGAEKSQLLKTASNLTQAADIKHVTDVIANSTDGLAHIAKDIPEEVRDAFMQKAQDIHQTLNPAELQKQEHAANISQAEEIAKQVEPLAKPENPNVLERIQAERKLNEAKGIIDENTKNLNKVLDEQEKRNQQIQEVKSKEIPTISETNLNLGDKITANINGEKVEGTVTNVGKNKGQIVIDLKDTNGNERFIYGRQIEKIESVPKIDLLSEKEKNRVKELINKDELNESDLKELEQLKTKENAIQEPSTGEVLQRPQEGIGETRGERPRVEPSIQGVEIAKEGEQAKINEEKGLTTKGLKSAETRRINEEANKIEATDSRSAVLKYLSGGNLSQDAINEIAGRVKGAELNTGRREFKTQEVKLRDYVAKKGEGENLDEAVHNIWQDISKKNPNITTEEVKNDLMRAVLEHTTKSEAAKSLIEGYKEESIEELERKHYEKYGDNAEKEADSQFNDAPKEDLDIDKELINANYETEQQFQDAYWDAHQATYNAPKETPSIEAEKPAVTEEEKIKSEEAIITHAANAETREKLGLNQPELLSNLTDKERYDKAQEMIKKGYDMNKLIDKMYNPEEVLNPLENAISNLYKQSLLSEIEKNPSNENLALAKRFLDARDQANSRAGAALQSLKGEAPKTILDFYVNKMEDNNTDILTDKQKEEAKKEYEGIKAKLDIVEAKNKELEKLNSELLAQKAIDEQKGIKKTTTKEKRDYTAERKEVINSIKEKLKKARTGQGGLTAVPIPYAKELAEIAPDVAKLVRLYVEEGAEKLDDVVGKIYDVLKDEIKGLQKKDVQDVIAGKYGKPNKAKTEVENKIKDLKIEAKLINAIDDARQLKPKTEREKVEQNRKLTDLRKELNKVRKETGYYDESKLKSIIEKNKKETENLKEKLEKGDFEEKEKPVPFIESPELKKKYPELYNQYLDAVDAKDEQQHEYELKRAIEQMNALSKTEKYKAQAGKFVKEGFSTIKALKAGIDNSAVFVQNGIAVLNPMNYKATGKALVAQTQDLFSESRFRRRIVEVHENKPLWNLISESGLDYLDPKGYNKAMRDEQFGSTNWLERKVKIGNKEIQIAKYTTAPFERLFTSFSNEFRLQIFLRGAEQLAKEGMTIESNPKEYQDLASYVNNITGRGKVHETLKPAEGLISNVIWAPKLLSSSLNMVGLGDLANLGKNKGYYRGMTPKMRKYAIGQTAAGIGTGIALMAAYSLLPNKQVDWDPESVTFGQMKDTETGWGYNVFGRLTPIVRYLAMMTMLSKKVGQGKAQVVDPLKETYKFVRGKMQPTAGIFSDVIMRKDFSGKPYKLSNVPSDLFEPLFINDLRQQLAIDGTTSLLTKGIPAFYGLKVSNDKIYDKRDLKSLENTIDSSTIDKNTLFNYNENRPINNHEYKEFITKRDDLLKDYYKNIHENGVPIINKNGKAEILPIDSKELTKDIFMKELNRLKGLATKNAKKDLFGSNELTDEQLDVKDELSELRDKQGIGSPNQ